MVRVTPVFSHGSPQPLNQAFNFKLFFPAAGPKDLQTNGKPAPGRICLEAPYEAGKIGTDFWTRFWNRDAFGTRILVTINRLRHTCQGEVNIVVFGLRDIKPSLQI